MVSEGNMGKVSIGYASVLIIKTSSSLRVHVHRPAGVNLTAKHAKFAEI